ncbi:hypothetical protein P152DRAFT_30347 [Eremomyces bilateralis CBS 781.70]|uniref:C6 transcription factor n=1 Tax=Eremomyces bilateralis CBS 781.70 TaxID=1392243 RepID=A0A6G1G2C1_9PEZI|nr:uncharacterized protein P152DRAFT_30347 [Eremomyces bilateralis CBS 781.70]KAF1812255.1 hypothetical protein P152DRAFT_30347 [Eremomyces bilateralis CBS 781.70]
MESIMSPFPEGDDSVSPMTTWSLQGSINDPAFLASQDELRALLFTTAQTPAPSRRGSLGSHAETERGDTDTADVGGAYRQMQQILASHRRLEYLKNYIGQVAPWLDMFDSHRTFGIQIPALCRNPALLYSILALSARQMELKEGKRHTYDSLELYQVAIKSLKPLLQSRDQDAIAVCVILCCMEMMSASGEDWHRHLDGCAALFDSFNVHGFSNGLWQALFWCYARMDLCGALMSDGTQGTLIHSSKWLPPGTPANDAHTLFAQAHSSDMHANYAVYLCAQICELLADRTKYVELGEENGCTDEVYVERWMQLWDDLQCWLDDRPAEFLPIQTIDAEPFPFILFLHWAAISANQLHHTGCILLLNMAPKSMKGKVSVADATLGYAKRICGISVTNPHQGCLNNAIQPLWIAGRHLTHRSEHAIIIKLFKNIEDITGWVTSWRIADLETTWGYKIRKP